MKVLIGVDGSLGSVEAVRFVSRVLSPERDQIGLYYSPPDIRPRHTDTVIEVRQRARKALADAVLAEMKEQLAPAFRSNVHLVIGSKHPKQGLLLAADEWRADMIAVGARGTAPLRALLLGSVSQHVVNRSRLPVLVVRGKGGAPSANAPLSVLMACDGSPACEQAAKVVGQLSWPAGSQGWLISVVEGFLAGEVPKWLEAAARDSETEAMAQQWAKEHDDDLRRAQTELTDRAAGMGSTFTACHPMVAEGHAAEQILNAIDKVHADLVVVGAHGLGTIERLFIGGTSDKILSHAPCSVLVVRAREKS